MTRARAARILRICALAAMAAAAGGRARADLPGAFPRLEPWPQTLALAGIPSALGEGPRGTLDNPAGMLHRPAIGAAVSHASLFGGGLVRHQAAALAWIFHSPEYKIRSGQVVKDPGAAKAAIGLGIEHLSGDLPADDSYGEIQISLAYARQLRTSLRAAGRARVIQASSTVDGSDGAGYAVDLGLEGVLLGWRIGGVARALATEVRWDRSPDGPIPAGYDIGAEREVGAGVRLQAGTTLRDRWEPRRLAAAAAWEVPGTPVEILSGLALRDASGDRHIEISGGAVIHSGPLAVSYGVRTGHPALGDTHRFGLGIRLP